MTTAPVRPVRTSPGGTETARVEPGHDRVGGLVSEIVTDVLGAARPRLVALGMSRDEHPKVTVLAFLDRSTVPALVVKVAQSPAAATALDREAAALRLLADLDPGRLGGTVPRCLELRSEPGCAALATTACRGVPMSTDYHRWRHTASPVRVRADFEGAAGWLDRLGRLDCVARPAGPGSGGPGSAAPVDGWPARIRSRWPGDPVAERVAGDTTRRLGRLDGPGPATTAHHLVHGDFWCGNILRHAGTVSGVVDWEHAAYGCDPVRDRTRFALAYALYLDRHTRPGHSVAGHRGLRAGRWGEPVRHVLRGSGWFPAVVAGFLGDGLTATGRSPERWCDAVLVGLAEVAALSDHEDFARRHLDLAAEVSSWRC